MNEKLIAQLQLLIELAKTGEEFEFSKSFEGRKFKFENGLLYAVRRNEGLWNQVYLQFDVVTTYGIIRKPWKPKVGEMYWFWTLDMWSKCEPFNVGFDSESDLMRFAFGNCFRTKEECESHPEVRDKLIEMRKEYE